MNCSGHARMDQAYELKVAGSWKIHGINLPVHRFARGHARGAIEAGAIGRCPWTAPSGDTWARRSDLAGFSEGYRMDLGGGEGPRDAVASVDPKLIRQEGERLPSPVSTLGASGSFPSCWLSR